MRTYFCLNDNEVTRKELKNIIGEAKLKELVDYGRYLYRKSKSTYAEKYYVMVDGNMVALEFVG